MQITVQLTHNPIAEAPAEPVSGGAGAWAEFRGIVRGEENGEPIAALEYEAYVPMAERELRRLLEDLSARHPVLHVVMVHRLGVVPVGEPAVYVGVAAPHRGPAFALLAEFMDRLKQDVPIWKRRAIPPPPAKVAADPNRVASADDLFTLLLKICPPLPPERAPLAECAGRILREPICAPEEQPPFDRSSVDGYVVRLGDPATRFNIVEEIRAGDWKPRQLLAGEAVRIATGGALPGDGLQVIMREDVQVDGSLLSVLHRQAERNVRFRGEDARAGQILVEAGTVLSPGALALLASVGAAQPLVTRRPRVLHIATGNEIVPPDQTPKHGQIRDSNSTMVRAVLEQWRVAPEQLRLPEDETAVEAGIQSQGLDTVNLLLISGGASVGEHDFTRRLLERLGFHIHVHRTATRPGKPLIVAQRGGTLAFGLPGNPLSHFVCLHLFVRTALRGLAGSADAPCFQTGVVACEFAAGGHARETFWPARRERRDGVSALTPLRWRSSGDLTALATANALLRVPAGVANLPRGSRVEYVATETNT